MRNTMLPVLVWVLMAVSVLAQPAAAAEGVSKSAAVGEIQAAFNQWLQPLLAKMQDSPLHCAAKRGDAVVVSAVPFPPLTVIPSQVRYHGMHLAVLVYDDESKQYVPVAPGRGLDSSDRFKVRVLASFDGEVLIDNINPKWQRKRIFPSGKMQSCMLTAGVASIIPSGEHEYMQFGNLTGEDKLVVRVRDPRSGEEDSARLRVYRAEWEMGVNFIQEAAFDAYPDMIGTLKIKHQ